jgi:hypothetical protein
MVERQRLRVEEKERARAAAVVEDPSTETETWGEWQRALLRRWRISLLARLTWWLFWMQKQWVKQKRKGGRGILGYWVPMWCVLVVLVHPCPQ